MISLTTLGEAFSFVMREENKVLIK